MSLKYNNKGPFFSGCQITNKACLLGRNNPVQLNIGFQFLNQSIPQSSWFCIILPGIFLVSFLALFLEHSVSFSAFHTHKIKCLWIKSPHHSCNIIFGTKQKQLTEHNGVTQSLAHQACSYRPHAVTSFSVMVTASLLPISKVTSQLNITYSILFKR